MMSSEILIAQQPVIHGDWIFTALWAWEPLEGHSSRPPTSSEACLETHRHPRCTLRTQAAATDMFTFGAAAESNDEYLPCMAAKVGSSPLSQFANL